MGRSPTNTRQKLIDTATDLIWQSSYGSTSVDDICKTAGVKKGSFYHYFPSKVDLALATIEENYAQSKPLFDTAFSPSLEPIERYEHLVELAIQKQKDAKEKYGRVCGCPFATLGSEMAGQEEKIRAKVETIFDAHRKYHENAIRDLVAQSYIPKETDIISRASEIQTYIMGQLMSARIQNSLNPIKDLKTGVMRILGIKEKMLESA